MVPAPKDQWYVVHVLSGQEQSVKRIKRFLYMMDSMTEQELNSVKPLSQQRMIRIAKGSGTSVGEVDQLIEQHKQFAKMVEKMGKLKMNNKSDL